MLPKSTEVSLAAEVRPRCAGVVDARYRFTELRQAFRALVVVVRNLSLGPYGSASPQEAALGAFEFPAVHPQVPCDERGVVRAQFEIPAAYLTKPAIFREAAACLAFCLKFARAPDPVRVIEKELGLS